MPQETQKAKIERLENEIKELEQLNENILQDNRRLGKQLSDLQDSKENDFRQLPVYCQLTNEIDKLKSQIRLLEWQLTTARKKNDSLIGLLNSYHEQVPKIHNARGAGRKACDAKQQAQYDLFEQLMESSMTPEQIMKKMQISRATFFRYKKHLKN